MASLNQSSPAKKVLNKPEDLSPVKVEQPLSLEGLEYLDPAPNRDKQRVLTARITDLEPFVLDQILKEEQLVSLGPAPNRDKQRAAARVLTARLTDLET
eukprot:15123846-Heterocapsa_arctica.AAC.1